MHRKMNLIGQKFNRLLVTSEAPRNKFNHVMWNCLCDCGNTSVVKTSHLTNGGAKSCGCLKSEISANHCRRKRRYIPNDVDFIVTRECQLLRGVYTSMVARCSPGHRESKNYYDRGVRICDEWSISNPKGFANFVDWALGEGGWSPGLQIDKEYKDQNNLLYCPAMCKFVSKADNGCRKRVKEGRDFTGVYTCKANGKFFFQVSYNYKLVKRSGYRYTDRKEAAIARDRYIIENNLPHTLNFPELRNEHSSK